MTVRITTKDTIYQLKREKKLSYVKIMEKRRIVSRLHVMSPEMEIHKNAIRKTETTNKEVQLSLKQQLCRYSQSIT